MYFYKVIIECNVNIVNEWKCRYSVYMVCLVNMNVKKFVLN